MSQRPPIPPALLHREGVPQAPDGEQEPSELFLTLTALPRPFKVVPYPRNMPGTDDPVGEVAIWPLSQEEQMACNAEADRFTKKLLKDPQQRDQANLGYHHTYTNEVAIQVLFRACRNPKDLKRPAFPSPAAMRPTLSTDEVGVLFNHYCTVQQEIGPIAADMSTEEMEGFILRLQAAGSAFPFDTLSWEQQRTLVSSMASQLITCWMVMFSAGLPLDVTTYALDRVRELVAAAAARQAEAPAGAQESAPEPELTPQDTTTPEG